MEWVRAFFYTSVCVALFSYLHFSNPEIYKPVSQHPLYVDLVTPNMALARNEIEPYWELFVHHPSVEPHIKEYLPAKEEVMNVAAEDTVQNEALSDAPQSEILEKVLVETESSIFEDVSESPKIVKTPEVKLKAQDPSTFPNRAPASIQRGLDEGTRVSAESRIFNWAGSQKCSQAKDFYKKLLVSYSMGEGDPWKQKMDQYFVQRCP